ncbi:hypothetical protein [Flavobacterium sp. ZB4P13]|uniref:hypothetical protein n=1 Tax=Flavobacterium sp. ZB4P13 TaxID=3401728 RepID=UPI003AAF5D1F
MKNTIICFVFIFLSKSLAAQDLFFDYGESYYKAVSNIVVADSEKGTFNLGVNYEFQSVQAQMIYNLTKKYFAFGTYNFDNSSLNYTPLLGSNRTLEKQNSGFSLGVGIQELGRIGNYKNLELLAGFESQKVNNFDFFTNDLPEEKDHLKQKYFKIFTQFNMMKCRENFDFGYSLKFSYLKFTHFEYNNENYFNNKSVFLLDPTLNFNYKFLPKKNLVLTSQIGVSTALNNLESQSVNGNSTYYNSGYLISPILRFGIQYRFNMQ